VQVNRLEIDKLTLIHLISIPVTNTSVNTARSASQALFVDGWAIQQLWLFWIAPIVGAILAGIIYRVIGRDIEPDLPERLSEERLSDNED
jgi:aquaporin Z